jgi:low affinity Fe/Cu permease
LNDLFHKFARKASEMVGTPWAFSLAITIVIVWASFGPRFHWSDTHQLVINTGTTIITFLMVFLIQNTQNRDARGIHLKLDELIKATQGASNTMLDLDQLSDEQLEQLEKEYKRICDMDELTAGEGHKAIKETRKKRREKQSTR